MFPAGGTFVDVGANVGTYALALARHVGAGGKVIAIEPHPVTHARLAFNNAASGYAQVKLVAAAAGPADGELMIETDGENLGASHIVSGTASGKAIRVPSLRLQRILEEGGVSHVDALKIDVEGFEDRVLTGFFAEAPQALWPRAVVIEHLSKNEWQQDCIADMRARGYAETGRTRSNTLLVRNFMSSPPNREILMIDRSLHFGLPEPSSRARLPVPSGSIIPLRQEHRAVAAVVAP